MILADGIIALRSLITGDPANLAKILQQLQIPVYGAEAESRDLRAKIVIDHFRRGVGVILYQIFVDPLPLPGVAQLLFHRGHLLVLCSLMIAQLSPFVNNNNHYY